MFDLLEHVENPLTVLEEAKRVLKKNGIFHIFLPLDRQPGTLYQVMYKIGWQPKDKHTGHLHVYTDKMFEEQAKKVGFSIEKKKFSFHFLFSIFDIMYFSALELFNLKAPSSIEGMVEEKKENLFVRLFNILYRSVIFIGFIESRIFAKVSGGGGHFTLRIR